MRIDVKKPCELSDTDVATWKALLAANPNFSSPYLTPEWSRAVCRQRTDARVVVYYDGDAPVGFLPVQRHSKYAALPLGGPICDYQALICAEGADINPTDALKALNVHRIDFTYALKDQPALGDCVHAEETGHIAQFANGWSAYEEDRRNAGSQILKRIKKKQRKFAKSAHLEIGCFVKDDAAFAQLLAWKSAQHHETHSTNVLSKRWIRNVITDIYSLPQGDDFGGAFFTLRANGDLAAGLFCIRSNKTLHAWYVGHNHVYDAHSPGLILFAEAMKAASEAGYHEMDFGAGDYRFKQSFANCARPVGPGYVGEVNLSSIWREMQFQVRDIAEHLPIGRAKNWPGKAMRKMDVYRGMHESH